MAKRIEQYIPIIAVHPDQGLSPQQVDRGVNFIQLALSYNLGGVNLFNGKQEPRGYYLIASPIEKTVIDGTTMFSGGFGFGVKRLLLEVSRQSDKQCRNALNRVSVVAPQLLDWCRQQYGLVFDNPDAYFPDQTSH